MKIILTLAILIIEVVYGITKVSLVDHNDPNYTDRCLQITGELCDYCCLEDFEWCSRDIYNCEPIRDRNLDSMEMCLLTVGGVIFGFPFLGYILHRCVLVRFCDSCFPNTSGVSIFQCLCRGLYFSFCCGRTFSQTYEKEEDESDSFGPKSKKGCCKRIFCCL